MRGRWSNLVLGALVGAACALAVGQWNMHRMRREAEAFRQSMQTSLDERRAGDMAQIAIAGAARAQAAVSPAPAAPAPPAPPPPPPAAPAKAPSREELWQGTQVHVRKHLEEPLDREWSGRVTPALDHDVKQTLSGTTANLSSLSCRSTSCLGTIDWPTLAEARNHVREMMVGAMRVNCARTAMLPPDATDDKAPVRMDVLFDCAGWKAKGSETPGPGQ